METEEFEKRFNEKKHQHTSVYVCIKTDDYALSMSEDEGLILYHNGIFIGSVSMDRVIEVR